jgi:hypothetical protein
MDDQLATHLRVVERERGRAMQNRVASRGAMPGPADGVHDGE